MNFLKYEIIYYIVGMIYGSNFIPTLHSLLSRFNELLNWFRVFRGIRWIFVSVTGFTEGFRQNFSRIFTEYYSVNWYSSSYFILCLPNFRESLPISKNSLNRKWGVFQQSLPSRKSNSHQKVGKTCRWFSVISSPHKNQLNNNNFHKI